MTAERMLDEIIALEKALQEQVDREKERIRMWREQERSRLELQSPGSDRQPDAKLEPMLQETRQQAERRATRRKEAAREKAARLAGLTDDFLRGLLRERLQELLPEAKNDRPDGQG